MGLFDGVQAFWNDLRQGGSSGHLPASKAAKITKVAPKFRVPEIQAVYKQFVRENPSGKISKEVFLEGLQGAGLDPGGMLAERLWQVFSKGRSSLGFEETIAALQTGLRGKKDERLSLAFTIYDLSGTGYLEKAEVALVLEQLFDWIAHKATFNPGYATPEDVLNAAFPPGVNTMDYQTFRESLVLPTGIPRKELHFFRKGVTLFR